MRFLIDGYNLLFALGRLTAKSPRGALDGARGWLLDRIRRGHAAEEVVTVVFDARTAPPGVSATQMHGSVRVEFAVGQTADDLIEDHIDAEHQPKGLSVVSDDHRVQRAARRRGCAVLGCLDYYERLLDSPPPAAAPAPPAETSDKPDRSSPEETRRWLDTFGEIDGPAW